MSYAEMAKKKPTRKEKINTWKDKIEMALFCIQILSHVSDFNTSPLMTAATLALDNLYKINITSNELKDIAKTKGL